MCRATNSSSGPEAIVVAIRGRCPRRNASRTAGLSWRNHWTSMAHLLGGLILRPQGLISNCLPIRRDDEQVPDGRGPAVRRREERTRVPHPADLHPDGLGRGGPAGPSAARRRSMGHGREGPYRRRRFVIAQNAQPSAGFRELPVLTPRRRSAHEDVTDHWRRARPAVVKPANASRSNRASTMAMIPPAGPPAAPAVTA